MSQNRDISRYVLKSFFWGTTAKLINAIVQFISVPLLLVYFGKEDYGLITLAISFNAYLQLLDMGINTGAIKHFSEWISFKRFDLLNSVARTSISFYAIIGLVNAVILVIFALYGTSLFSLTETQSLLMRNLLLILAMFAIFNWSISVFNQLLTANEQIYYIQYVNIAKNILTLILIILTIKLNWSMSFYFFSYTFVNVLILVPFYFKVKRQDLIRSMLPGKNWTDFGIIFRYSIAIITMGIFQMSAVKLRPVVLSIFSTEGIGIVSDFRIMETITLFVLTIGGMFVSIFLPTTSKLLLENNWEKVASFAYSTTKYTSIISTFLCIPFILCGKEILKLYVGDEYVYLYQWLAVWIFTILFFLHNSPVASLVLSTGKTKMLVYSSAIACIVSLFLNALLCSYIGVGSAIVGYAVYIVIQMLFYYFYFNNRILHLESKKVFVSFIIPASLGVFTMLIVRFIYIDVSNLMVQMLIKVSVWASVFLSLLFLLKILSLREISVILKKKTD